MSKVLQVGNMAPEFSLPSLNGIIQLNENRGKNVVLYFYPKDLTSGCTQQAIEFNQLRDKFAEKNTVIFGVSADTLKKHQSFCDKYSLLFSLLSDEDKVCLEAYGVWVEKSMYGKKYMGIERTTFLIDTTGKIAKIWHKVKVKDHALDVLNSI